MRSPILYFFLVILEVLFNMAPDAVYKCGQFLKVLLKKSFEFFTEDGVNPVLFLKCFMLLPSKINPIPEE